MRVSRDEFVAHAEPCLAVNPRDPRNLLGACIAHGEGGTQIAAYASFDGGASWRSLGGLEDSAGGRDPTVTFDAAGRGYVCANTDDLHVWLTDDGGRTFAAPVLATRGHKLDHPWLAADPASSTPCAGRPGQLRLPDGRGRAWRQRPRHLRRVAAAPVWAAAAGVRRPDQGHRLDRPRRELGPAGSPCRRSPTGVGWSTW